MSGKLVIVFPNASMIEETVTGKKGPALETLQRHVGGYIERVKVRYNDRTRDAYVNEEGLLKGLPYNPVATRMLQGTIFAGQSIVGSLVIWVPDPARAPKAGYFGVDPLSRPMLKETKRG